MRSKIIQLAAIALLTLLLVGVMAGKAQAAEIVDSGTCGADGDNLTWTLDDKGLLTISGTGRMKNYSIMYSDNNYAPWYDKLNEITVLQIKNGVTSIGDWAFSSTALTKLNIAESVTSIGQDAFSNCTGLTKVTIPKGVTSVGDYAFSSCTGMTEVTVCGDWEYSWYYYECPPFYGCTSLKKVVFTDGVTRIGTSAFSGCTGLEEVLISDSVARIGDRAFFECRSLTELTIPVGVTTIGEAAFYGCAIKEVTVCGNWSAESDRHPSQNESPFLNCPSLEKVTFTDGVTSIGDYAFCGCGNLTDLEIPSSVTSVGLWAFASCTKLAEVTICGNWNASYTQPPFIHCSSLKKITFKDKVTSIGNNAFKDCTGLSVVIIPSNVISIGENAFSNCTGLTEVMVCGNWVNNQYSGSPFSNCPSLEKVTFTDGVTSITKDAFKGCTGLAEVTIPASVKSIGAGAFSGCTSLTDLTVQGNFSSNMDDFLRDSNTGDPTDDIKMSESYKLNDGMTQCPPFYGCDNLRTLTIGPNVTYIQAYSFNNLTGLRSVVFKSGEQDRVITVYPYAFQETSMTDVGAGLTWDYEKETAKSGKEVTPGILQGYGNNTIYISVPGSNIANTILSVTRYGKTVSAIIACKDQVIPWCATYDKEGKLLEICQSEPFTEEQKIDFTFKNEYFDSAKVFLLNDSGVPQCESKNT